MVQPAAAADSSRAPFWDGRYAAPGYLFGRAPSQFVRRQSAALRPSSRVLCVADGEGRNSVFLAGLGCRVEANDISDLAIAKARDLAAAAGVNVSFASADLSEYDWPRGRFDAVFAVFIQFAPPALRDRIFAGLKTCVAPGGLVLLHGYTPKQVDYGTGGPSNPELLYTPALLNDAFGDCELVELRAYEADLDEGEGHSGRSALIDLVARTRWRPGAAER